VAGCTVRGGRIVELDLMLDRQKLAAIKLR
jgi:hypothetical protein